MKVDTNVLRELAARLREQMLESSPLPSFGQRSAMDDAAQELDRLAQVFDELTAPRMVLDRARCDCWACRELRRNPITRTH